MRGVLHGRRDRSLTTAANVNADAALEKRRAPYVGLSGWYGHGNIGDELMLERLVHLFRTQAKREPIAFVDRPGPIGLCEARYDPEAALFPGLGYQNIKSAAVWALRRWRNVPGLTRLLDGVDAYVVGGGTRAGHHDAHLARHVCGLRAIQARGRRVMLYGIGFAQGSSDATRKLARELVALADLVVVRDTRTYGLFSDCTDAGNLLLAADPLYALRATMADILSDLRGAVASAGVAVLCPRIGGRGVGRPAYRAAVVGSMAAVADELCALGLSVRLVPLWREDDPQLCWQIAARVNCPNAVQITDVPSTAQEFGRLLGGAAVVLSMPLHGTLLSVLAGVPTVPVVYHPKCEELSKELGLSPIAVPVSPEGAIPVGLAADHAVAAGHWYTNEAEDLSISTAAREREVLAAEARLVEALVGKVG